MRRLLTSLSAFALSAGIASAGTIAAPPPQPTVAPPPAPTFAAAYDWTGGYFGLGATYGRTSYRSGLDPELQDFGFTGSDFWPKGSGWGAGAFVGFNWQNGNMVYGVEGHVAGHRMRGTTDLDGVRIRSDLRSTASLRGRVGFSADRTLVFLTAGPALGNVRHEARDTDFGLSFSESNTVTGFVIGVGVEHALPGGWNIRGDLEHHRFGSKDFDTLGPLLPNAFPNLRARANIARVSAVFRF